MVLTTLEKDVKMNADVEVVGTCMELWKYYSR